MSLSKTLHEWQHGLRIFHRAHARASSSYEQKNIALGLPTVILTAVAGTTVFTTISSQPETWVKVATGIMSLTAAVLAALQTFLRYSERAEKHKNAAQNFGMLRREMEEVLAQFESTDPPTLPPAEWMKSFRERWDAVDREAISLPQHIYDEAEKQLRAKTGAS